LPKTSSKATSRSKGQRRRDGTSRQTAHLPSPRRPRTCRRPRARCKSKSALDKIHVRAGSVRAYAVTSDSCLRSEPTIPTSDEARLPCARGLIVSFEKTRYRKWPLGDTAELAFDRPNPRRGDQVTSDELPHSVRISTAGPNLSVGTHRQRSQTWTFVASYL
jgi:hypothetical protein